MSYQRSYGEDSFQGNRSQTQWQSEPLGLASDQSQGETSSKIFYHKDYWQVEKLFFGLLNINYGFIISILLILAVIAFLQSAR